MDELAVILLVFANLWRARNLAIAFTFRSL